MLAGLRHGARRDPLVLVVDRVADGCCFVGVCEGEGGAQGGDGGDGVRRERTSKKARLYLVCPRCDRWRARKTRGAESDARAKPHHYYSRIHWQPGGGGPVGRGGSSGWLCGMHVTSLASCLGCCGCMVLLFCQACVFACVCVCVCVCACTLGEHARGPAGQRDRRRRRQRRRARGALGALGRPAAPASLFPARCVQRGVCETERR